MRKYCKPLHAVVRAVSWLTLGLILVPAAVLNAQPPAQPIPAESLTPSAAQMPEFDIPAQSLSTALAAFARQSGRELLYTPDLVEGRTANAVAGPHMREDAIALLLKGTDLDFIVMPSGGIVIGDRATLEVHRARLRKSDGASVITPDHEPALAAGAATVSSLDDAGLEIGSDSTSTSVENRRRGGIEEIIVTAQKREERIQDIPIAISAFTSRDLDEQKLEGGFDLLKAMPNVTFSKSNFTSYNFSIRGIGTKAVSATSDPGVAIAFNSAGIIQNRLFEQEYFDIERVEVLRGPQGTLYGRNATGGVVNVISAKPDLSDFEGSVKAEVGNYDTRRLVGVLNVPLLEDKLAVRLAGSSTQRDGYDFNSITGNDINGRDLWSTRLTVGFKPTDWLRGDLIWERFEENDNRSRTGKQLCHRHDGPTVIGTTPLITDPTNPNNYLARPAIFSTGCQAGSLYDDAAFGTPNGMSLPFVLSMIYNSRFYPWGYIPNPGNPAQFMPVNLLEVRDPFGGLMQSRDLREIASIRDPIYRANADILQANFEVDLMDNLTLISQSVYVDDGVYSFQDFNRFNSVPIFRDTTQFQGAPYGSYTNVAPGGIFCDPQIGCADRMAGFDVSRSSAEQFTQEFRLASSFGGPINFSIGANYTEFDAFTEYFVMNNVLTALAMTVPFNGAGSADKCSMLGFSPEPGIGGSPNPIPMGDPNIYCPYIDPNPVETISGEGHNYFRSANPYRLRSTAAFGELYWNFSESLSMTAGLRYTSDQKTFTQIPTQLLLAPTIIGGGLVSRGSPSAGELEMKWGEWTGRLGVHWRPETSFTDETLLYATYSRGYKGGGANPPTPGFATVQDLVDAEYIDAATAEVFEQMGVLPVLSLNGLEYGATFAPEFVNAFEIGTKNTLLGGTLLLNATAFYYDYADYQVSQIRNRTAVNENFDAEVWGVEFETVWNPTPDLRINANLGHLQTRIGDGEQSIDIMNRNLGNPDYLVVRSWAQIPANCVVPVGVAEAWAATNEDLVNYYSLCGGLGGLLKIAGTTPTDPATGMPFTFDNYD